ncbi:hypothetical protein SAMN05216227_107110 [Pseudorhodobacter antarcticus]|jgi:hypothetical protein|uniref:Uncharacterized protein n=1 Tax=Pseudorhodobacter antarcticus TaxID=1077947 RepID=A0A1H8N5T6_9RHOB|nr:hypothetical protein [Pseudorhodobacter antarcticus]SEO24838.1 hypothetical protein SAMN05216227_107110 [Pseudorhodobacter antarcticus]
MTEQTTILQEVGQAFRDHGLTSAITALIGGTVALLASVTRKAFTNDAMLARLDRELLAERTRVDRQRAEDRETEADRLERIEADIRAMRDLMFEAFQRGRTD